MTDRPEQDITTQILIQIRDEMRLMRSDFEKRFDGVEAGLENLGNRMESLEGRMASFEGRMESLEGRMDALETRMDSLEGRMDSLEARMAANEAQHKQLFGCFEQLDSDIRKFVGIANETILHYADEMDSVRDRLDKLENKVGIPALSD